MTTTALVSTILLTLGAACTTAPFDDGTRTGCISGETQACTGTGACAGGQVCLDDGTWGDCDCGEVDGGAGGDGGTSSDGGGAGTDGGGGPDGGSDGGGEGGTDGGGDGGSDGGSDGGAAPTMLDASEITFLDNPPDLASWPETTQITLVEFGDHVHVEFSKQDGEERWPDIVPPGWDGPLQYTLGLAEYIDGQWYGSAAIQFWYGLYESGGNVALDNQIAVNWYYDSRWGALEGRQPATGEVVGLFVVAGNVRGVTDGSQSPVMERSNVVLVPFPDVHGAVHTW